MARTPRRAPARTSTGALVPAPDETTEGQRLQTAEDTQQAADAANNAEQGADAAHEEEGVTRTEDGGAIISLSAHRTKKRASSHWANLVEHADDTMTRRLNALAFELHEQITQDIEAGEKSVQKYATALGATGMTDKAPGGAQFPGASAVTHPILGEVCADYAARVCREMLPPGGPAKPHVEGTVTKEKFERAQRVARYINYQTRKVMRNFAAEIEQTLTQEPFDGAGYIKLWREGKKPCVAFVPANKVHRPANADDFYSCERITHEFNLSARKLKMKMRKRVYVTHEFGSSTEPDKDKVEQVAQKVTGISPSVDNVDKVRTIWESSCFWSEEEDGDARPYIVTIDKETKFVLALYRNWEEVDTEAERLDFLYEFGFWPFLEGKPVGLSHMLSGLPKAATGAMRALLDSALANNFPGALKLKSGQSGSNNMPGPGQMAEIENATGIDDIRKMAVPVELNPPSNVLFEMLGFVVDAAKGMVRTTFDDIIGKGRQDIPVGTMMMLVDEGTVVYSSIFGRQHRAMERLLAGLYRLNHEIVDREAKFTDDEGEDVVTRADFEGDSVVVPTSDPRINSDTQRWTRANFVAGRAAGGPMGPNPLYNQYEVEKMLLDAARVENVDVLLVKPQTPTELSAVNENVAVVLGRAVVAFPEQNHLAHLEVHADFVKSPMFGMSKSMQPAIVPAMVQHFKEHIALEYAAQTMEMVDDVIARVLSQAGNERYKLLYEGAETAEKKLSVVDMMRMKEPDLGRKVDKLFAAASALVLGKLNGLLTGIMPLLDQMNTIAQQFKPPAPMDPTQATIQAATMATEAQKQIAAQRDATQKETAQIKAQGDATRSAQDAKEHADNVTLKQAELQQEGTLSQAEIAQRAEADRARVAQSAVATDTHHIENQEDNKTALTIAAAEIADGGNASVSNGGGINP